ncbi:hypothetical protein BS50DRAFT_321124 [Corynespora cassiicola Philippines]|uniref:Uncharacterized protein n=1 Tax=Corynespora cassiicola Philippines TaxID=1448308 RepID=A0A2T2NT57_CORCC|nr:hypothetical protein BS50DRAFT_321124 [Corynespora cassiicola Philippines]
MALAPYDELLPEVAHDVQAPNVFRVFRVGPNNSEPSMSVASHDARGKRLRPKNSRTSTQAAEDARDEASGHELVCLSLGSSIQIIARHIPKPGIACLRPPIHHHLMRFIIPLTVSKVCFRTAWLERRIALPSLDKERTEALRRTNGEVVQWLRAKAALPNIITEHDAISCGIC